MPHHITSADLTECLTLSSPVSTESAQGQKNPNGRGRWDVQQPVESMRWEPSEKELLGWLANSKTAVARIAI